MARMSNSIRTHSSVASFHTAKSHQSAPKRDSTASTNLCLARGRSRHNSDPYRYTPVARDFALQPLTIPGRVSSLSRQSPLATSSPEEPEDAHDSSVELQPLIACFDKVQNQRDRVTAYLRQKSYPKSQARTAATEAARHDLAGGLQKLLELERPIGHLRLELIDPRRAYHEETVRLLIQLGFTGLVSRGPGSVPEMWKAGKCPFFPDSMRFNAARIGSEDGKNESGNAVKGKSKE